MTPVGTRGDRAARSRGIAVVEVDRRLAAVPCDAVVIDNERGAREATSTCSALGHRRIGAARRRDRLDERRRPARAATAPHATAPASSSTSGSSCGSPCTPRHRDADRGAARRRRADRDLRRQQHARRAGLARAAPPRAANPGRRLARRLRRRALDGDGQPAITVVEQPTLEMGRRAARLLLRRLDGPALEPASRCCSRRSSCAARPAPRAPMTRL